MFEQIPSADAVMMKVTKSFMVLHLLQEFNYVAIVVRIDVVRYVLWFYGGYVHCLLCCRIMSIVSILLLDFNIMRFNCQ